MDKTYISVLTPPGVAAIAVVGVVGHDALRIVSQFFFPATESKNLSSMPLQGHHNLSTVFFPLNRAIVGKFTDGVKEDQAVLIVRQLEPLHLVELHCHGGLAVLEWVRGCLVRAGAIPVDPDAWLRFSAKDSPRQVALRMLQHAATLRTASILLEQFHGAWEEGVNQLAQAVAEKSAQAMSLAARLVELIPVGQHLCQPFRVVLAGAPNTGKSTLMNALLGYARAITSPQPGTTRDLVTAEIACAGWPVQLIDTAGWRETADPLEHQGIARAQALWQQADLVLWLCDHAAEPVLPPCPLPRWILVANKADLPARWHLEEIPLGAVPSVVVSACTGFGLEDLVHAIAANLVPHPPENREAVPFTPSLAQHVLDLHQALQRQDWQAAQLYVTQLWNA